KKQQSREELAEHNLTIANRRRVEQGNGARLLLFGQKAHGDEHTRCHGGAERVVKERAQHFAGPLVGASQREPVEKQSVDEQHGGDDGVAAHRSKIRTQLATGDQQDGPHDGSSLDSDRVNFMNVSSRRAATRSTRRTSRLAATSARTTSGRSS